MPARQLPGDLGLVILAGGGSRRFHGRQKMLVDLGGRSIGNLLLEELAPSFSMVCISVRNKEQVATLVDGGINIQGDASFIEDLEHYPGGDREDAAIFGLYSAFRSLRTAYAFVVSGDMPFVTRDTVGLLADQLPEMPDAIVPRWENGYIEPTLAIYKVQASISRIETMLGNKQYQLVELVRGLGHVVYLPVSRFEQLDPDHACFVNVNSEKDLERARQIYKTRLDVKKGEGSSP